MVGGVPEEPFYTHTTATPLSHEKPNFPPGLIATLQPHHQHISLYLWVAASLALSALSEQSMLGSAVAQPQLRLTLQDQADSGPS